MAKGGYLILDLSTVEAGADPVTISGIYQKMKDAFGKPVLLTYASYGETAWGCILESDGAYILIYSVADVENAAIYPAYYAITNEDAVTNTIVIPDDGGGE